MEDELDQFNATQTVPLTSACCCSINSDIIPGKKMPDWKVWES
jgi:hypothetical protein